MALNLNLKGKVSLVTGSTRGIGWATARRLASCGSTVLLNCSSDVDLLTQRTEEIKNEFGVEAQGLAFDVGNAQAVKEGYNTIFKHYRRLDILVNNAGILLTGMLGMITEEQVQRTMQTNVQGVILNMQYAARLMARNNGGSIINITSLMGRVGKAGLLVYSSSKAAVIGMTLSAAKELAKSHIRVNAVAPGYIESDMTEPLSASQKEEVIRSISLERFGSPDEVAAAICFLASDEASYITGQILGVDGGI